MTANSHLDRISIAITLAPSPTQRASFGTLLFLADQAGGTTLGGTDRFRAYTSASDVDDDVTAGEISATVGQMASDAFSQPNVEEVLIGRVDTAGLEGYDDGLAACETAGAEFYGVAIESRLAADILDVSSAAETRNILFFLQSDDSDWLTTGFPAALSAMESRERTVICYHDTATEWMDAAYAANRLTFDPDVISYTWQAGLKEVADYATAPTAAQKAFLKSNNTNYGLPLGSEDFFVMPGVNANGRPIDHIVTIDWLKARVEEDLADMITAHASRGEKITVDKTGQEKVASLVEKWLAIGVSAGHFQDGQVEVVRPTITSTNRANKQIPVRARGTLTVGATDFDLDFNFSTDLINE